MGYGAGATAAEHGRWRPRVGLSFALRATIFLLPVAAGVAGATTAAHLMPRPDTVGDRAAWWILVLLATSASVVVVERLARRLLPLATLLKLCLLFPAKAPSRFVVALRAGSTRHLERRLQRAQALGIDDEPAKAAETILTLAAALTAHDRWTRGHSERVRAFTDMVAEEMQLSEEERDRLRWASLLHDIGKLAVSSGILNKPSAPDEDEWDVLHRHPEEGARLAAPLQSWLQEFAVTIEQHHEHWDGSGYPHGLRGDQISLGARIVSVADSYDTMTSARPYKRPMSVVAARAELVRCAGTDFDPGCVRAFLNLSIRRLQWVVGPLAWIAQLPFTGPLLRTPQEGTRLVHSLAAASKTTAGVALVAVTGAVVAPTSSGPEPTVVQAVVQEEPNPSAPPPALRPAPHATPQSVAAAAAQAFTVQFDVPVPPRASAASARTGSATFSPSAPNGPVPPAPEVSAAPPGPTPAATRPDPPAASSTPASPSRGSSTPATKASPPPAPSTTPRTQPDVPPLPPQASDTAEEKRGHGREDRGDSDRRRAHDD